MEVSGGVDLTAANIQTLSLNPEFSYSGFELQL